MTDNQKRLYLYMKVLEIISQNNRAKKMTRLFSITGYELTTSKSIMVSIEMEKNSQSNNRPKRFQRRSAKKQKSNLRLVVNN